MSLAPPSLSQQSLTRIPQPVVSRPCNAGESSAFPKSLSLGQWGWWFTLGVMSGLFLRLIGYLTFLEAYLLITIPIRMRQVVHAALSRGILLFTLLWLGWIVGSLIADYSNESPFSLAARGFSRAFFSGFVILCLLPLWLQSPRRFEAFLAGMPLAQFVGLWYFRSGTYNTGDGTTQVDASQLGWENWGNYFCGSVAAALIARLWRTTPWSCVVIALVLGSSNLALGSRAAGLMALLAAGIMPLFIFRPHFRMGWMRISEGRLTLGRLISIVVMGIITLVAVAVGYTELAKRGALGEKAKAKHEFQSSQKGGIVVGGRSEVLVGLAAIMDKPLCGHGSWPEDTVGYAAQASEIFGVEIREAPQRKGIRKFIKSHSAIVSAWLEHGILGAIFWIYVLYIVAYNLPRVTEYLPEYTGVVIFNSCGFFWAYLFSPIQSRAYTAMIIVPMLMIQIRRLQSTARNARR
jgi:hypothetical protein